MNLRTELTPPRFPYLIHHRHVLFSTGSCFAALVGDKLLENKFRVSANPAGIFFNPLSIFRFLGLALQESSVPDPSFFVQHQETWYHYDFHSDLRNSTQEGLREEITKVLHKSRQFLQKTDFLLLTFGTAWVYQFPESQRTVSNCHKQPAYLFEKRLLNLPEIKEAFTTLHKQLLALRPGMRVLVTVSPVRHLKDTLPLNSVSKALLRLFCYELCHEFPDSVFYFPAFEFLMDDLRDYRFYDTDLIHPNELAEDYIWQKFGESLFGPSTQDLLKRWNKIRRAILHRPFEAKSSAHQGFLRRTLAELEDLNSELDLSREITEIKSQII